MAATSKSCCILPRLVLNAELGLISIIVNSLGMYAQASILEDQADTFEKMINTQPDARL